MLEQVIVLSLLNSGVRRGELAGLTWKDVNFEECTIHISKSLLVFKDYGYQLTTTRKATSGMWTLLQSTWTSSKNIISIGSPRKN